MPTLADTTASKLAGLSGSRPVVDPTGALAAASTAAAAAYADVQWNLVDLVDNHLSADPYAVLTVEILLGDGTLYATFKLTVFNSKKSDVVALNPDGGLQGLFKTDRADVLGAYTQVTDAYYNATGRKPERLLAAMDAVESLRIVSLAPPPAPPSPVVPAPP
jgi:hypothetical protein